MEDYGGGFVMVGGFTSFGAGANEKTPLERIIPVTMDQERDITPGSFKPRVSTGALAHSIMQVGADAPSTRQAWLEKLPQFTGFNRVDRAKPGAVVLLEHPAQLTRYGPCVILAVQEIGKGRSMAFTTDTTRGWGQDFETLWGEPINGGLPLIEANCDRRYYRQFWANAIRWLAAGRVLNSGIQLELARESPGTNRPVGARVILSPETPNAEVSLSLVSSTHAELKVPAKYNPATRDHRAEFMPAGPGQYVVTAAARQGTKELGADSQFLSWDALGVEEIELRANPQLMAELAAAGGGKALSPALDVSSVTEMLSNPVRTTEHFRYRPLWDKPIWLLLIVSLLTAEWVVRRSGGLA